MGIMKWQLLYGKALILVWLLALLPFPGSAQFLMPTKKKLAPRASGSKVRTSPAPKKQAYAKFMASSDLAGQLYLNEEPYPLEAGKNITLDVPKDFSFYFMTDDGAFITNLQRRSLLPHEKETTIAVALEVKKQYEQLQRNAAAESYKQKMLNYIDYNMVSLKEGRLTDANGELTQKISNWAISRFEVTVQEFELFLRETQPERLAKPDGESLVIIHQGLDERRMENAIDWRHSPEGRLRTEEEYHHPVVHVSWDEAMDFCQWLTKQDEYYRYRLPTVKEWEYAAGCGDYRNTYPWGNDLAESVLYANFADRSLAEVLPYYKGLDFSRNDGNSLDSPVGAYQPTCFGLYDMGGNVAEWCLDDYVQPGESTQRKGEEKLKAFKGGSYFVGADKCRVSQTYGRAAGQRHCGIGFRICRELK